MKWRLVKKAEVFNHINWEQPLPTSYMEYTYCCPDCGYEHKHKGGELVVKFNYCPVCGIRLEYGKEG